MICVKQKAVHGKEEFPENSGIKTEARRHPGWPGPEAVLTARLWGGEVLAYSVGPVSLFWPFSEPSYANLRQDCPGEGRGRRRRKHL